MQVWELLSRLLSTNNHNRTSLRDVRRKTQPIPLKPTIEVDCSLNRCFLKIKYHTTYILFEPAAFFVRQMGPLPGYYEGDY